MSHFSFSRFLTPASPRWGAEIQGSFVIRRLVFIHHVCCCSQLLVAQAMHLWKRSLSNYKKLDTHPLSLSVFSCHRKITRNS